MSSIKSKGASRGRIRRARLALWAASAVAAGFVALPGCATRVSRLDRHPSPLVSVPATVGDVAVSTALFPVFYPYFGDQVMQQFWHGEPAPESALYRATPWNATPSEYPPLALPFTVSTIMGAPGWLLTGWWWPVGCDTQLNSPRVLYTSAPPLLEEKWIEEGRIIPRTPTPQATASPEPTPISVSAPAVTIQTPELTRQSQ